MDRTFLDVRSIRFTRETSDRRPKAFVLEKLALQEPTKWAGAGFRKKEEYHALQTMRLSLGSIGRHKEQRSSATGGRDMAEQPIQGAHSESDDTSDEQE